MNALRRKWTRPWLVVLAVLAVAGLAGVTACGGGDDDDDEPYDFNGTWAVESTVVQSNVPQVPVGMRGTDIARVTQSGTNITVAIEGVAPLTGTCDPVAGTFNAAGTDGPLTLQMNGARVDDDTMSGELAMSGGPVLVRMTYTANLVSRTLSAGNAAGDGLARALRSLR